MNPECLLNLYLIKKRINFFFIKLSFLQKSIKEDHELILRIMGQNSFASWSLPSDVSNSSTDILNTEFIGSREWLKY